MQSVKEIFHTKEALYAMLLGCSLQVLSALTWAIGSNFIQLYYSKNSRI